MGRWLQLHCAGPRHQDHRDENSLLVSVRALENGNVIQDYRFSYGVLTQPRMLSYTGHAPQGCGS